MPAPVVPFSEFLTPNKRPHLLAPDEDADLLGMRLYGQGPFHREHKLAAKIQKKSHFLVRSGDVIYNKLFAWKGTFGVVPPDLDGMFVSDKFPTYELDPDMVDVDYLRWYFRSPSLWEQARTMSTGSAALSKFTLNPPRFLELTMPVPSLDEQRRIATRLEGTSQVVETIRESRSASSAAAKALLQSFVNAVTAEVGELGALADVLTAKPRNGWSVVCDNVDGGTAVLTLGAVTGFHYDSRAIKRTSVETDPTAHYWLNEGDLLITRSNTPELVGHVAIYSGAPSPCIYSDLIMKVPIDPEKADTRFVWHWLQSPLVRRVITDKAKGTSPTMKKISQGIVMELPFPSSLDLPAQIRLRTQLDVILEDRRTLERLLDDSTTLVDQIVPAALRESFVVAEAV